MQRTITPFDTSLHHIHITFYVAHPGIGTRHSFDGIIDTGAPRTEFSDVVLARTGFITSQNTGIRIKGGMQTQKYGKLIFRNVEICGQQLDPFEAYVSKFDETWGVDALIGLDFFRKFRVTIDYKNGQIITEPE